MVSPLWPSDFAANPPPACAPLASGRRSAQIYQPRWIGQGVNITIIRMADDFSENEEFDTEEDHDGDDESLDDEDYYDEEEEDDTI